MKIPMLSRLKEHAPPVKYKIKYIGHKDYELTFKLSVKTKFLKIILEKSLEALRRKHGHTTTIDPTQIEEFEITKESEELKNYIKALKVNITKQFMNIARDCKKVDRRKIDIGIEVFNLDKAKYINKGEEWIIEFYISGEYTML